MDTSGEREKKSRSRSVSREKADRKRSRSKSVGKSYYMRLPFITLTHYFQTYTHIRYISWHRYFFDIVDTCYELILFGCLLISLF